MILFVTVCMVGFCGTKSTALRFYLNNNEERCFTFDAEPGTRQRGEAKVERKSQGHSVDNTKDEEREIDVRVISTANEHGRSGHVPHLYSAKLRGATKFTFATPHRHHHNNNHNKEEDDDYEDEEEDEDDEDMGSGKGPRAGYKACVKLTLGASAAVKFTIRGHDSSSMISSHPTDDNSASDNSVKGISIAMREMHNTLTHLTRDISRLQQREHMLMAHNNSVGSRVVTFAIISLVILLAATALQVAYFSKFFKQKKLL